MPGLLSKTEFLSQALKMYPKADIRVFWSCPTLLDFSKIFFTRFKRESNVLLTFGVFSSNFFDSFTDVGKLLKLIVTIDLSINVCYIRENFRGYFCFEFFISSLKILF